jgi:hypothetical protein
VASLPVYWLDMRRGPEDIPEAVDGMLEHLGRGAR